MLTLTDMLRQIGDTGYNTHGYTLGEIVRKRDSRTVALYEGDKSKEFREQEFAAPGIRNAILNDKVLAIIDLEDGSRLKWEVKNREVIWVAEMRSKGAIPPAFAHAGVRSRGQRIDHIEEFVRLVDDFQMAQARQALIDSGQATRIEVRRADYMDRQVMQMIGTLGGTDRALGLLPIKYAIADLRKLLQLPVTHNPTLSTGGSTHFTVSPCHD